jgi:hypothetical protein
LTVVPCGAQGERGREIKARGSNKRSCERSSYEKEGSHEKGVVVDDDEGFIGGCCFRGESTTDANAITDDNKRVTSRTRQEREEKGMPRVFRSDAFVRASTRLGWVEREEEEERGKEGGGSD